MNEKNLNRRSFARTVTMAGIGLSLNPLSLQEKKPSNYSEYPEKLGVSLNAYSFDKLLRQGTMTISDMLDFCAKNGFDGVDLTGYYFPGYPNVPADDYIYEVKRKAFRLGVRIGGTGVRNDFTLSDPGKRALEKKHVKGWIVVAAKLGAPLLRIFTGLSKEANPWEEKLKWVTDDINECALLSGKYGVMLGVQNHNDFIKNASDTEKILKLTDPKWVGLLLDIGSYHTPDPYKDIALDAPHAISWQLKEQLYVNDKQIDTDFNKIISIVRECGYRGLLPIETLGEGDPYKKAAVLCKKLQGIIGS